VRAAAHAKLEAARGVAELAEARRELALAASDLAAKREVEHELREKLRDEAAARRRADDAEDEATRGRLFAEARNASAEDAVDAAQEGARAARAATAAARATMSVELQRAASLARTIVKGRHPQVSRGGVWRFVLLCPPP